MTGAIAVTHWKLGLPDTLRDALRSTTTAFGPLCFLMPGGGLTPHQSAPELMRTEHPGLVHTPEFAEWTARVQKVWKEEVTPRYLSTLARLRDDDWFAGVAEAAGLTMSQTQTRTRRGHYGEVEYKATRVHVPSLLKVRVDQDGLELVFSHRPGDPPERWGKALPSLRGAFKAIGMASDRLRVTEDKSGNIRLLFDDAPSAFPVAIAPPTVEPVRSVAEARRRYHEFKWELGLDARGTVIAPSISEVFHLLVAGGTGAGKSVWLRGVIERARLSGWRVYLGDGKASDYPALESTPGVVMRSSAPEQHVVLIAEVHDLMLQRQGVAEQRKRDGAADPFDFEPVLLVLDEFASMRADVLEQVADGKQTQMKPWLGAIAAILRKGRELRVHTVLASQDLYVENIPNSWQSNAQLLVSLGGVSDKTLATEFMKGMTEEAERLGSRITRADKGRGIFADRDRGRVREFQSFYSWSPGTTTLEPGLPTSPPTPEVRAAWATAAEAAQNMPRLYPRIGIEVTGPGWKQASVADLMKVPTVALDDENGEPLPDRVKYDHRSPDWAGREVISVGTRRGSAVGGHITGQRDVTPRPGEDDLIDEPDEADVPSRQPRAVEEQAAEPDMTAEQRNEAVRQEAIRLGYLPPDPEPESEPEVVETAEPEKKSTKVTSRKAKPATELPPAVYDMEDE